MAIRSLEIGFRITTITDCPRLPPATPITTTTDVLGSTVSYTLRTTPARNVLTGQTWMCAPQPTSDAVVNLYLDLRTALGQAQRVDRLFLDPVYVGPSLNLYWSNDEPDATFDSRDDPIATAQIGTVTSDEFGLVFGSATPSGVEVPGEAIQFDPSRPWWVGAVYTPDFNPSAATIRPLLDLGVAWVSLGAGKLTAATATHTLDVAVPNMTAGQRITFTLAQTSEGLWLSVEDFGDRQALDASPSQVRPPTLVFGGHLPARAPNPTSARLHHLTLVDEALTDQARRDFFADPTVFTHKPRFQGAANDRTENSLLRFDPEHAGLSTHGFVGSPADRFADLAWTPVPRDYVLRKGILDLPPTVAKFWKLEFSNLVAAPYESFVPIRRKVKLQPPTLPAPRPGGGGAPTPGRRTLIELSATLRFVDTPLLSVQASVGIGSGGISAGVRISRGGPPTVTTITRTLRRTEISHSPTEAAYAPNPATAANLRDASPAHGYQTWHQNPVAQQWDASGRHYYDEATVEHSSKVAFFVGLRSVAASRIDYEVDDDTLIYRERFDAPVTMGSSNWDKNGERIVTRAGGEMATSKTLPSTHRVRALQFASRQTLPLQVAPDDDFRDPALAVASWSDLEAWHVVGTATPTYLPETHSVHLDRGEAAEPEYQPYTGGLMQQPDHPAFAVRALFGGGIVITGLGGLESPLIRPSGPGRMYAAARVVLDTDLSAPLWIQIVSKTGDVLAEESKTGRKGERLEWHVGHSIATITSPRPHASGLVDAPDHPVLTDATITSPPGPLDDHVRVRLIQKGESGDKFTVDTLSLFDEAIEWEFSVDDGLTWVPALDARNNPYAVVTFPEPGKRLRWRVVGHRPDLSIASVSIRPWYVGRPVADAWPQQGPNVSTYDHIPPITADPEFGGWPGPIPQAWYARFRQEGLVGLNFVRLRTPNDRVEAGDSSTRTTAYFRTGADSLVAADTPTRVHDFETIVQPLPKPPDDRA